MHGLLLFLPGVRQVAALVADLSPSLARCRAERVFQHVCHFFYAGAGSLGCIGAGHAPGSGTRRAGQLIQFTREIRDAELASFFYLFHEGDAA